MFDSLPQLPRRQRWRNQSAPAPVVVALIRRQMTALPTAVSGTRYLLIERNGETYSGQWALVGGKWDFGETLPEAIVREVKEETTLDATFVAVRGLVSERVAPSAQNDVGAHFLIFVCELLAADGEAQEQQEGPVHWFTLSEIDILHSQSAIIPSDYAMIRSFAHSSECVPHIEAEMRATLGRSEADKTELLRFERI